MTANPKPRIAVLLSGSGYLDGAEIRESVFALLALEKAGADFEIFSLDKEVDEVDHLTHEPTGQKRNMLHEAARIARGKVADLQGVDPAKFDGVILPGGFGVALHFCSFAKEGALCQVDTDIEDFLTPFIEAKKPIGAICVAPALIAKLFESRGGGLKLTLGNDSSIADQIKKLGSVHEDKKPWEVCIDADHKVVSTPAYMYDDNALPMVAAGIETLVNQVLLFCENFTEA